VAERVLPPRLSRAERQAQTRAALIEAAARVFVERGFVGSSVEAIAAEAGFTRGAFYSNFESKEQLFVELLHERVYDDFARLIKSVPTDMPPAERVVWGAERMRERYENAREDWLFELLLECLAHAARRPEFRALPATFWSGTREMNARGIEAGFAEVGKAPPIEAKHLATAMTALDIGLAVQHLVDPDEVPLELYPRLYGLLFASLVEGPPDPGR
jgi:AcrR family transcriptional regulator